MPSFRKLSNADLSDRQHPHRLNECTAVKLSVDLQEVQLGRTLREAGNLLFDAMVKWISSRQRAGQDGVQHDDDRTLEKG